jgi:ABC-type polysaccharide transport system permease subunit
MFEDLFVFYKQRDINGALGFYIVYALLGLVLLALLGMLMSAIVGEENILEKARRYGQITAVVYPFFLSLIIVQSKSAFSIKTVLLIILSGALGVFGIFFGLFPTAFLTMHPNYTPIPPKDQDQE